MTTGLILLVFIAAVVTFFVVRPIRRRMGMGVNHRTWIVSMALVALAIGLLWAYQTQR
jgi:predicted PurR-regulated permease PerM